MNYINARQNMVAQQVRPWAVFNQRVIEILNIVPREQFVPTPFQQLAYSDTDIPLSHGQTMLSPKVVGRALEALNLQGNEKVLEIGTGTGFVTACLAHLTKQVISIEIDPSLLAMAEKNLHDQTYRNVTLIEGNGALGWQAHAPYDAIIVTGSYPIIVPPEIGDQLKPSGRLFAVQGLKPAMRAVLITRQNEGQFKTEALFETVIPTLLHAVQPAQFKF